MSQLSEVTDAEHVRIEELESGEGYRMWCEHCGGQGWIFHPIVAIRAWAKQVKFLEAHRDCLLSRADGDATNNDA